MHFPLSNLNTVSLKFFASHEGTYTFEDKALTSQD